MVDWKELGEIPDSEDEDAFESQDPEILPKEVLEPASQHENRERDIWDFPSSQEDYQPQRIRAATIAKPKPLTTRSSPTLSPLTPLSSLPPDIDLPDVQDLILKQLEQAELGSKSGGRTSEFLPVDDASPSFIDLTSQALDFADGRNDIPSQTSSRRLPHNSPLQSQELGEQTEEQAARQIGVRYERSLRPRKPIQEHPYQLESLHYSGLFKKHGIKPVRISAEEERKRQEAVAFEDDFVEPSQASGQSGMASQADSAGPSADMGNMEAASSSPPKTSPLLGRAAPSSQASSRIDTDNTSNGWDDADLPAAKDLILRPQISSKKHTPSSPSPLRSTARKRRRYNIIDSDPAEARVPGASPDHFQSPLLNRGGTGTVIAPSKSSDRTSPTPEIAIPDNGGDNDEQAPNGGDSNELEAETESSGDSGSASESGSEFAKQMRRRLRGVLPASWVRLDQQNSRAKLQKDANKRSSHRSPEREQKRGVAQRRQAVVAPSTEQFLFDDSDEDIVPSRPNTTDDLFHQQTRLLLEEASGSADETKMEGFEPVAFSGDESVIEADHVDQMLPGRKRQLKLADSSRSYKKRRRTLAIPSRKPPPMTQNQPKITSAFNSAGSVARTSRVKPKGGSNRVRQGGKQHRDTQRSSRRPRAPMLSILDVIEPKAPQFLKIAARTARQRVNQGRSSPSRKCIRLATRQDHIDAVSTLNDWKTGSIRQRESVNTSKKPHQTRRRQDPLSERSANIQAIPRTPSIRPLTASRKFTRNISEGQTVSYQKARHAGDGHRPDVPLHARTTEFTRDYTRPALLEMDEAEQGSLAFHTTKKLLDRMYRKKRALPSDSLTSSSDASTATARRQAPPGLLIRSDLPPVKSEVSRELPAARRRRRKPRPQRIDTAEPQYRHANDPLPFEPHMEEVQESVAKRGGLKLTGLGPYGTHYTHHFEVFPLRPGVFFHESTIIGSGTFQDIANRDYSLPLTEPRPRVSYQLGNQMLRWGTWDAQSSSELGILLDFIADQLEDCADAVGSGNSKAADAAAFILRYSKDALAIPSDEIFKSFVARMDETLRALNARISTWLKTREVVSQNLQETLLRVYDRLQLAVFLVLQLCRERPSMPSEQMQTEDLVGALAKTTISSLVRQGFGAVKKTYAEQNMLRRREEGIRDDAAALHSWVLVSKILELSCIPRSSFWDVVQTVIGTADAIQSVKISDHERCWEDMFMLLPLTEFNDAGVLVPGLLHHAGSDGWSLPQKLLKRVFQLYRDNSRQPVGFNNYCRALVGRCHYLVQQWGWRRSSGVVGVIFDFFGSQNLAHLRNEEVYKSPTFLEQLAKDPNLDIEGEDRCFHIFLKLVAISIRKLDEVGATKGIRNLVARTMPNHDRQHLKEQRVHERDLAALRNHHDLLCTLFWAAPAELRPSVTLFERLVVPASSHKEACLINLRSWSQLARFIVAGGEATTAFEPFAQWRDRFFHQIMQQFDSVASDVQREVLALSKDVSYQVSADMISTMISLNKTAVKDVLHAAVAASLDVMRHCPDLEAAMFALNTAQLQLVFKHFAVPQPELDWSTLQACISVVDSTVIRIDDFKANEESQQSVSNILTLEEGDDALLVLDHTIAKNFFSMARCVLSSRGSKNLTVTERLDRTRCTENLISTAARLGARFIGAGVMNLSDMFTYGKYGLFEDVPSKVGHEQRQYLVLFVAKLLKYGFDGFGDANFSLSELWTLSIVKPQIQLMYENQLAQQLRYVGKHFIPEAIDGLATSLDYNTNRDLFECTISWMRKSVRDSEPSLRKGLIAEYGKTLRLAMEQIKGDLKAVTGDSSEHYGFVCFVREIVALVKAHGSDLCVIDEFFYQVSKEYSPSAQDPQLQVAGMVSYGLRFAEDEAKVAYQLFFYLLSNFKFALINDKLDDESRMLRKGMRNDGIRSFVLGRMLPAVIQAVVECHDAYPLLDVYTDALYLLLRGNVVSYELIVADMPGVLATLRAIGLGLAHMASETEIAARDRLYVVTQLLSITNLLYAPLFMMSLSRPTASIWDQISQVLQDISDCIRLASAHLPDGSEVSVGVRGYTMRIAAQADRVSPADDSIITFSRNIVDDVRRNWIASGNRLTIQAPGKAPRPNSTESGQGIEQRSWDGAELYNRLQGGFRECNYWWEKMRGVEDAGDDGGPRTVEEALVF